MRSVEEDLATSDGQNAVWVVEKGLTGDNLDRLLRQEPELEPVEVRYLDRNLGWMRPRNMALWRMQGRHVAVMDSDI